jgi:hypothetical protein
LKRKPRCEHRCALEAKTFNHIQAEEVAKLRVEVEERNRQLQQLVNGLTVENLELKQRILIR